MQRGPFESAGRYGPHEDGPLYNMLLQVLTRYMGSKACEHSTASMQSPAPVKCLVFELCGSFGGLLPGHGAGPAAVPVAAGLGE